MQIVTEKDIDILARTIYGEARCEYNHPQGGLGSLIAVGNVVMNRLNAKRRFGNSIEDVCLKPFQFSCWNAKDPMRKVITGEGIEKDIVFKICQEVASAVANQAWPDFTRDSNHYHAYYCKPDWADPRKLQVRLGRHYFYKLG
ncbi:Cell Wall Hydrolase [Candidatus Bealeia paramacronuclearis]|uniref:Cell Wall Hydrolase n=1 Tax=Candidatus Bealeia paramacronuclearis TaxID=1921001 RepID=A0ABZ2C3E8_9PROT|nr:Cell Wall Hydrolase [Candidatus Bealeia paramacronuclearis]